MSTCKQVLGEHLGIYSDLRSSISIMDGLFCSNQLEPNYRGALDGDHTIHIDEGRESEGLIDITNEQLIICQHTYLRR